MDARESGAGEPGDIERAKRESRGLGLFVRTLVGLHRHVAKHTLARFTVGKRLTANQMEFLDLIVNHLAEHGVVEPAALYESPFTDVAPRGPEAVFNAAQVEELLGMLGVLDRVRATALAA